MKGVREVIAWKFSVLNMGYNMFMLIKMKKKKICDAGDDDLELKKKIELTPEQNCSQSYIKV